MWFLEVYEPYSVPFGYVPADLFSFLQSYGYECYSLTDGKLRPIPGSGKLPGYNFLCIIPGVHSDRVEKYFP
mgnify:CR=1 FL=1